MNLNLIPFITGVFIFFCFQIHAQKYDFTDGLLPSDWAGQRTYFEITADKQLHLNAPTGTTSAALVWPALQAKDLQWEFYVSYAFAASSTNYANFYLLSSTDDLSDETNASYYLKIGGASGSTDKIELIYQDETVKYTVLASAAGLVGASTVSCRVRVYKNAAGNWELYTDITGNHTFTKQAEGQHNIAKSFPYSGIRCVYSSTRRDKFYFDDISMQQLFTVQNYVFDGDSDLKIYFSDTLQMPAAIKLNIDFGIAFATTFFSTYIELKFAAPVHTGSFSGYLNNVIAINGDTLFNKQIEIKKVVTFYVGKVRFTEWMSDPSPSVGLPEIEWVELLNTSEEIIDMATCSISDPSTRAKCPAYLLKPDSVVVVCSSGGCSLLEIKNCIEVSSLPSLNNSADSLFLWANDSILIDYIHYELTALTNDNRRDGGYSIERKELPDDCSFYLNIDFSSAQSGGTPGLINNLAHWSAMEITPLIIAADNLLIDINSVVTIELKNISSETPVHSLQNQRSQFSTSISILFETPVSEGSSTALYVDSVKTCRNNMQFIGKEILVIYPENIKKGDVYINEVLYNPYTGGVDFIELHNTTRNYIQLKNTHYYNKVAEKPIQQVTIAGDIIIEPLGYKVLTGDSVILKQQYTNTISKNCVQLKGFLSLPDDGGCLTFTSNNADTLDQIYYGDQFQNPLNRNDEGISLEKIIASEAFFSGSNWTSSASKCTPGYINSQNYLSGDIPEKIFYCNPCHVTTNLNGADDYALLHLNQMVNGCFANISIYKLSGERIEDLCINQLLGSSNTFQWNGQQHGGGTLEDGIYVAVAEWWSPDGKTFTSKIALSTSQY